MLRFVILAVVVASAISVPESTFFFKNDITPEEAQGYLRSLPFNEPVLAGKTATLPLVRYDDPRFRAAEAGPTLGHYWKNGKEIENTNDYLEEVYNAAQYHGQDGLGQYAYGYETPESSKVENREGSGLITGSYVYKSPGNPDLIKVKYWADSQGFHQEDNIPKVELKPAEETPALREARLAFEKAWKEAAEANQKQPVAPYYEPAYQGQASEARPVSVAPAPTASEETEPAREGKAYGGQANYQQQQQQPQQYGQQQQYTQQQQFGQQGQYNQQGQYGQQGQQGLQGQYSQQGQYGQQGQQGQQVQQEQYSQQGQYGQQQQQQYGQQKYGQQKSEEKYEEPEPTGPPHGFFYSFTYPVSIIVPKNEQKDPSYPVDQDTVGVGLKY